MNRSPFCTQPRYLTMTTSTHRTKRNLGMHVAHPHPFLLLISRFIPIWNSSRCFQSRKKRVTIFFNFLASSHVSRRSLLS